MSWISAIAIEPLDAPIVTHEPETATSIVLCPASGMAAVVGPRPTATYSAGSPGTRVRLRLAPGRAAALFGIPVADLAGRIVPVSELWGDAQVRDLVRDPIGTLARRADRREPNSDLVAEAARLLAEGRSVQATADRLHLSERYLRTLFTGAVGLSPKTFARVERVRAVLARVGGRDLARLAAELGYYDQSHLTNEFRAVMGVPPAAYAHGRLPNPTRCQSNRTRQ
ncbi:MAG TPA: helix-turn-helix domain-containing protein [Micromonosporaceae bacterium]|nr:helix-turn-helix domain-containing protein [Micromonosporaceae bacterium]